MSFFEAHPLMGTVGALVVMLGLKLLCEPHPSEGSISRAEAEEIREWERDHPPGGLI